MSELSLLREIRKPYQPRLRVLARIGGPSLTKQSFAGETNINSIMARFEKTGLLDHVSQYQGSYMDLIDAPGFHDAANSIIAANEAFESLPSSIRRRFNNDPSSFLEFVQNEDNFDQLVELGLARPKDDPDPKEASASDPSAAAPEGDSADSTEPST
ncbi:internal scaffolding protein [Microviridae sp.]|nr:internal scaffolding protein [Microviridae sp.]